MANEDNQNINYNYNDMNSAQVVEYLKHKIKCIPKSAEYIIE